MYKAIIIGGSAGSFMIVNTLLQSLKRAFDFPIFLVLHRSKHVRSGFVEAFSIKSNVSIIEPYDKKIIKNGVVYVAPANYHMYFALDNRISLSTEEQVNHSRPSIDLSFMSAGFIYQKNLLGILLSGANTDGAKGIKVIKEFGGTTIIQNPADCQFDIMTQSALNEMTPDFILNSDEICNKIYSLIHDKNFF